MVISAEGDLAIYSINYFVVTLLTSSSSVISNNFVDKQGKRESFLEENS